MSFQVVNEVIILTAACSAGIFAFPYLDRFFRIMFLQLATWIIFYTLLHLLTIYQHANGLQMNNQWLMNIHMIIETLLLIAAALSCFRSSWGKGIAAAALFAFLAVVAVQASSGGFSVYFNYADVTECISVTVIYSLLLSGFSGKRAGAWWLSPEIVLCLGLLVYFACSVPYMTMMHYLQVRYPVLNELLFDLISNVLAYVRYLFLAIAFWLVRRNALTLKRTK